LDWRRQQLAKRFDVGGQRHRVEERNGRPHRLSTLAQLVELRPEFIDPADVG